MAISKDKQYRTRDGREVRIYATDGENNTVHGAILNFDGWAVKAWRSNGMRQGFDDRDDLIEVRPRHKRMVWLNVYHRQEYATYASKGIADTSQIPGRIACIKVELDFEEGEGL